MDMILLLLVDMQMGIVKNVEMKEEELWEFDLSDPIQFKQAVHYTNLQPLTIDDHRKKTAIGNIRRFKNV